MPFVGMGFIRFASDGAVTFGAGTPVNHAPAQPTLSHSSLTSSGVTLTGSAFSDSDVGDTHAASQWQVTTAADTTFLSPVISTGDDATHKTSYAATGLSAATNYIARLRYKDSAGNYSAWSASDAFTTSAAGSTVYASDAFTGTDGTAITSHTPDAVGAGPAGTSWTAINVAAGDIKLLGGRLINAGAQSGSLRVALNSASAAPTDQTVTADFVCQGFNLGSVKGIYANMTGSGSLVGGYCLRYSMQSSAAACYFALFRCDDSFGETQLGSNYSFAFPTAGTVVPVKIVRSGSQVSAYVNGSLVIGPITDATPLTGVKAGHYCLATAPDDTSVLGVHIDNIVLQSP